MQKEQFATWKEYNTKKSWTKKVQHAKIAIEWGATWKECSTEKLKQWKIAIWKLCNMNATQKMKHNKILQEKLQGKKTWK